jgi:hypothetical protein
VTPVTRFAMPERVTPTWRPISRLRRRTFVNKASRHGFASDAQGHPCGRAA